MNDYELSMALAELSVKSVNIGWKFGTRNGNAIIYNSHITKNFTFTDWNDLMPLVIEHEVDLNRQYTNGNNWLSGKCIINVGSFESSSEMPQRALAECLIKLYKLTEGSDK